MRVVLIKLGFQHVRLHVCMYGHGQLQLGHMAGWTYVDCDT